MLHRNRITEPLSRSASSPEVVVTAMFQSDRRPKPFCSDFSENPIWSKKLSAVQTARGWDEVEQFLCFLFFFPPGRREMGMLSLGFHDLMISGCFWSYCSVLQWAFVTILGYLKNLFLDYLILSAVQSMFFIRERERGEREKKRESHVKVLGLWHVAIGMCVCV